MSTRAELRAEKKPRRPLLRSFRFWIPVGILLLLIVLAVAGLLIGKPIYDRAMSARSSLVQAMPLATQAKNQILAGDSEGAAATAEKLSALTADAREQTDDGFWKGIEWIPVIGPNLKAVRTASAIVDDLVAGAVIPATGLDLKALAPVDGAINLAAITDLQSAIAAVDSAVESADLHLAKIDPTPLIPQVGDAIASLTDAIDELRPMLDPVDSILSVLHGALGANGPRDYLLMFQGTSEARSLGGNAAVFIVMRADQGALSIIDLIDSQQFQNAPPDPVLDLDPEAEAIFGDKIGRYTADFTMVPDYPEAVRILQAWWQREGFTPFDAAISVDPIALSYILGATGPVQLPTGDVLTSGNAASLLLNEVYFRYRDPFDQNVFFGAAAGSVFSALTRGSFDPVSLIAALSRSADEGRILYWSQDHVEQELIAGTRMQGVMPSDNEKETVLGVYINDNTGSKMSYYLDMGVKVCRSESDVKGTATLTSSVTPEQAAELPRYITGQYFTPGDISTYVVLYGPPGSGLSEVTVDGSPARIPASGQHLGRPAVKIDVLNRMASAHSISFTFDGVAPESGPLEVWHTPLVRDTIVQTLAECVE